MLATIKRFIRKFSELIITYLLELLSPKGHMYIYISTPYYKKNNTNWGDDVNHILAELISGKKVINARCKILPGEHYLCIGSILQWFGDNEAIVWGTGLIEPSKVKPCKKFLAVRGPLTRAELIRQGYECPEIYGDPALLFPRYYNPKISKKHKIGIICHYSELNNKELDALIKNNSLYFINIKNHGSWNSFIDKVLSCNYIISSSLHGIIISDAYNIPNLWCKFSNNNSNGNYFKFKDYYLSVRKITQEIELVPFIITKEFNANEIIKQIEQTWKPIDIDLDQLMDVCPFKQ